MVRNRKPQEPVKFTKSGAFSHYSMDGIVTIEGILTSFRMDELEILSYARELQSPNLKFDVLIQRDLNESRARDEIGAYILPEGNGEDHFVFLPPLIAAIVITNERQELDDYYPEAEHTIVDPETNAELTVEELKNKNDILYRRKWGDILEVSNYSDLKGAGVTIEHNSKLCRVDISQVEIEMNFPYKKSPGIKLVVIDGQHRLFALLDRYDGEAGERMKNLLVPVMLVYPPDATEPDVTANNNQPSLKLPDVFRSLFVDVNKNSVNVSGHFLILLSDTTLGSIICRSFCQIVTDEDEFDLAMVEWNTRSDKESKTINKEYSITSIGVLYDTLNSIFQKEKIDLLRYLMDIHRRCQEFYKDDEPLPESFPWQEFKSEHKPKLNDLVKERIRPCLIEIFFHSKCYGKIQNIYTEALEKISKKYKGKPGIEALEKHLQHGQELHSNTAKEYKAEFIEEFKKIYNKENPSIDILRKSIFQKGMIFAWIEMLDAGKNHQLDPLEITKGFVKLLDHLTIAKLLVNGSDNGYLQESVFRSNRIIVSNSSRKQISRLILSFLKNSSHRGKFLAHLNLNEASSNDFEKLGENALSEFLAELKDKQKKTFGRNYKTDPNVKRQTRKELEDLEKNERLDEFDERITEEIQFDYNAACEQLENILNKSK
ncbi:MAG: ParB N-terminal domain-containing protein [Candidatus Eutrophobiaceae bacterium]